MSTTPYLDEEAKLRETIRSRGHWQLIVRPSTFKERVSDRRELFNIISRSVLDLGGWRFPFMPPDGSELKHGRRHVDTDWVGQLFRWDHHLEVWRCYTSGQFALLWGVGWDWRDESGWWPVRPNEDWRPNVKIGIGEVVRSLLNVFMFSARLSESAAGDEAFTIQIELAPIEGRALFSDFPNRALGPYYQADVDRFGLSLKLSRLDLLSGVDQLTVDTVTRVFGEFGFKPSESIVRELIAEGRR